MNASVNGGRISVLTPPQPAVIFNPDNKAHRVIYAKFLQNGRWPDATRFQVEYPFTSAPTTIQAKLVSYALRKELAKIADDQAAENQARAHQDFAAA